MTGILKEKKNHRLATISKFSISNKQLKLGQQYRDVLHHRATVDSTQVTVAGFFAWFWILDDGLRFLKLSNQGQIAGLMITLEIQEIQEKGRKRSIETSHPSITSQRNIESQNKVQKEIAMF